MHIPRLRSLSAAAVTRCIVAAALLVQAGATMAEVNRETHPRQLLDAINAGSGFDTAVLANFSPRIREERGTERLAGILEMLSGDLAPARITRIDDDPSGQLRFILDSKRGWVHLLFETGPAPDYLVDGFSATPGPPPLDVDSLPPTLAEATAGLLAEHVADNRFAGAVLIARDETIVFSRAYGMADIAAGRRNTLDTPFNLGSMNKMFTAVAIAQLAERGKLDYGDTVGKHLPDYPDRDVADRVTIHHLLTHTSGLGHYWNDEYDARKGELRTVSDFATLFAGEPLQFTPGESVEYSNNGPVVLGLIIERLSDMDYYEYVRRYIYQPVGMWHSGHYLLTDNDAGFAQGYLRDGDNWVSNQGTMGLRGSPAGGGYASARDMLRFSRAFMGGKLVDAAQRDLLIAGKVDMGPQFRYGYGFGEDSPGSRLRFIGHNGGAPGISADFSVYPDLGYTVIVLANYDEAAFPVAERIRQFIAAYASRQTVH